MDEQRESDDKLGCARNNGGKHGGITKWRWTKKYVNIRVLARCNGEFRLKWRLFFKNEV